MEGKKTDKESSVIDNAKERESEKDRVSCQLNGKTENRGKKEKEREKMLFYEVALGRERGLEKEERSKAKKGSRWKARAR